MNEDLVLAITMLIILAVVVLFIQISQQIKVKRIQKMKIQRRFGEIPDMEEVLPIERISVYHKHQGREDVDQVTWSDLSMDQVFQRIDQCDSAAGEAVLYNMLHCTDNGQAQWKELLKYYEEQAEPRKKAEAILISLGKREGLYYLPEYVDNTSGKSRGLCVLLSPASDPPSGKCCGRTVECSDPAAGRRDGNCQYCGLYYDADEI